MVIYNCTPPLYTHTINVHSINTDWFYFLVRLPPSRRTPMIACSTAAAQLATPVVCPGFSPVDGANEKKNYRRIRNIPKQDRRDSVVAGTGVVTSGGVPRTPVATPPGPQNTRVSASSTYT